MELLERIGLLVENEGELRRHLSFDILRMVVLILFVRATVVSMSRILIDSHQQDPREPSGISFEKLLSKLTFTHLHTCWPFNLVKLRT